VERKIQYGIFQLLKSDHRAKKKNHPNSADAGVVGDLHTLRIDHLFFLQSNESNFFPPTAKRQRSISLWLGFCSLDAHE
jgi:hypothetical protein